MIENNLQTTNPKITEEYVRNIPEPTFTDSWHPLSHGKCITVMEEATKELGIKTQRRFYSLSKDNLKMLAAWTIGIADTINVGNDSLFQCILFRNSIDKSYSFGINGGTDAYICENLMVFGKFVDVRRHTGKLDEDELYKVVIKGIINLKSKLAGVRIWHRALHNIKLKKTEAEVLSYSAIKEKIISQQRIPQFNSLLFGDNHRYNPLELFGWHGSVTEIMRDLSGSGSFLVKQNRLHSFIQKRYGNKLPIV